MPAALRLIATDTFDALITDLHMPNPSDGFTVVSAMRHSQPYALTLLVSGYPDVQSAMAAILLEADEIIVKPFEVGRLADLLREKMSTRKPAARMEKQRVAGDIAALCLVSSTAGWRGQSKRGTESQLQLSDEERTGHLPKLVEDLIVRLRKGGRQQRRTAMPSSRLPRWRMANCDFCRATLPRCWCMNRESSK